MEIRDRMLASTKFTMPSLVLGVEESHMLLENNSTDFVMRGGNNFRHADSPPGVVPFIEPQSACFRGLGATNAFFVRISP